MTGLVVLAQRVSVGLSLCWLSEYPSGAAESGHEVVWQVRHAQPHWLSCCLASFSGPG